MKKILLFCLCMIAFPLTSNAVRYCSASESITEQEYLNNVDVSYSVSVKNDVALYTITLKNLTNNMVVKTPDGKFIKSTSFKNGRYSFNMNGGSNIRLNIYSKKCLYGDSFVNVYKDLNVPAYNKYYSREECKDFKNNYICQKWSNYSANEATFKNDIKKLQDLQNKKESNTPTEDVKVKKKWYQVMREVVAKFWWAVIILVLGIIGIYYAIWSKNKKKQFDFKV